MGCVLPGVAMAGEDFETIGTGAETFRAAVAAEDAGETDRAIKLYRQHLGFGGPLRGIGRGWYRGAPGYAYGGSFEIELKMPSKPQT